MVGGGGRVEGKQVWKEKATDWCFSHLTHV